jgi:hypothetical protein
MRPPRWRGRRRLVGRQGVEAPVGVAQAQKRENAGQGGTGGDTWRWRRNGGVAEVMRDSGVTGVRDELRWSAEVVAGAWSTGKRRGSEEWRKFGWKHLGEAELIVRPRWRHWRLPNRRSGAAFGA